MPFKVDKYISSIREVSDKKMASDQAWRERYGHTPDLYFDTREEAVAHKKAQLEKEIKDAEKQLKLRQDRLKRFCQKETA